MRSLFLLWGCLVLPGYGSLVGPKEISGFEGDTVSLRCTYGEELKKFQKYWCRNAGLLLNRCSNRVYATEDGREKTVGKVSIQDSRHERTLKVTLRGISMQDAGQYWCGVQKLGFDNSVLISLLVFPGTSRPTARLDPPTAEDPSSSDISPLRTLVPTARTLAPVLVLISLLLATGLAALLTRYVFPWRKEAVLEDPPKDTEDEKVQLSHMTQGNSWGPECAVINLAGPNEPDSSSPPPACPYTEGQPLNQTSEENQASPLDAQGDLVPGIPLQVPGEESGFVPV
ncbi:CMRF35-like molecule 9 isoform X3 [Sorex fumeus]|uniref:CMRF35-like molecule 9 isoform X3 n=1 Tax=Sorex fumeus TaxID=62283 RepID=UPI0024AC9214|nr:CMRF35-like molecule 9 isoform X3 [Sorex fumeus]